MFCVNCGKPIEDGKTVCDECAVQELPYNPQEEPVYQAAEPSFQLNNPVEEPVKVKKPKKGFPVGAVIALAVVAAIVVCGVIFWDSITGFFVRSFGTPEQYLSHVENKAAEDTINGISGFYGNLLGVLGGEVETEDVATKGNISIEISEDILSTIGMPADMDLGWLSKIDLSVYTCSKDGLMQSDMGIGLGGVNIATLSMLMDLAEGDMYMGIPELSDTYLYMDVGTIPGAAEDMDEIMDQMEELKEMMDEISEMLPSEKKLNQKLTLYWGIVLENLEDVEKSTETVEVDGLEQKLTVIECTLTEEGLYKIARAILEDVQDDKELMKCVYAIAEYADLDEDDVDDALDEAIDGLKDMAQDADDDNRINLTTYVDSTDSVVGRTIEVEGSDMDAVELYYITVWEKDEFAFEANIADQAEITGSGSREKNLVNGEYVIEVMGEEMLILEVADYDEKSAEDGYVNGTFTISFGEGLTDLIFASSGSSSPSYGSASSGMSDILSAFLDLKVEVKLTSSEKVSELALAVKAAGVKMVSMTITGEQVKASDIKVPKDTIDMNDLDEEEAMEWILGMDFDKIVKNLEKAGLPDDIMDQVYDLMDQLEELEDYYG